MKDKLLLPKEFTDRDFDLLFSPKIQQLSSRHWTPLSIIKQVVEFLCRGVDTKILDIGSGSGKFCLIGAMQSNCLFYGVEKRAFLVKSSRKIARELDLENQVEFFHSSVEELDLMQFDAFYFFNSFHENLDTIDAIDKDVVINEEVYQSYTLYLKQQLGKMPVGTRVATYCSDPKVIPDCYLQKGSLVKGKLLLWEKCH
ncbi:methyltransferase domain-containing protein [Echinicola salinicaeni]|uniref:methyltransferase domain-containing protein n=1 Tax=Echinicola salinicaeni TaxID=2762757 RepID=UPI001645AF00|nr:methyltransferase domain-containing protein [Echinicola salinicaeni]